ncbi:MAG: hypothetical protein K5662_10010 [Lachnospiraceae bacterium]|nr:hypothetical protein [Lachnospiraceae bacterium]
MDYYFQKDNSQGRLSLIVIVIVAIVLVACIVGAVILVTPLVHKYTSVSESTSECELTPVEAPRDISAECALFSFKMPANATGKWFSETTDTSITIFDLESYGNESYGEECYDYIFNISAYKEPSEYKCGLTNEDESVLKIGELKTPDGMQYDMVVKTLRNHYYGYGMSESYERIYSSIDAIILNIKGNNGNNYVRLSGTRGEDLYDSVIEKYKEAILGEWDEDMLEAEGICPELYQMAQEDILSIGYCFFDMNNDNIEEMLIGRITENITSEMIYDIYTIVDRVPTSVLAGPNRKSYPMGAKTYFLIDEYINDSNNSQCDFYYLEPNSTNLITYASCKYDPSANEEQPWVIHRYVGTISRSCEETLYRDEETCNLIKQVYGVGDYAQLEYKSFIQ